MKLDKINMLDKDTLDREVYESALTRMKTMGLSSILASPKLVRERNTIKDKIMEYYESTEEFEKCGFIQNFFEKLEKEVGVASIISGLGKSEK